MPKTTMRASVLSLAMAGLWASVSPVAHAQSLIELYESARAYDATYQSARLQYDANVARADQARAGILPSAGLTGSATRTDLDITPAINPALNRTFSGQSATISASQPLYRPANWAAYAQGKQQLEVARAQLDSAEQDLIVRTSQAYFDVLASQDSLTFVKAQKAAVAEQLASARRNFEVGTATITDTREAQARYDLVLAQEIAAENDLRVKKIALDQLVGKQDAQPLGLAAPLVLPPLEPAEVNAWVQRTNTHPGVRQAQSNLEIARLEVERAQAGHKPTLDLTASYAAGRNPNGTASLPTSSRNTSAAVGLALNVPLFSGFATQNRIRETLALGERAQSDLEGARRTIAQNTRTAFFGVVSGQGQVKALEAAELSSQSALDANRLGYQVGVRINIDVLNSQSQLFQTKRDLARARYDVLVGNLRLRQASGTLAPQDLQPINALLAR